VQQVRSIRTISIRTYSMQRMRQHGPQKRFKMSVACPEHKRSNCEGPGPLEPVKVNRSDCPQMQGCGECGGTTRKSASSFACPEHKCSNCQGTFELKGHNRNNCPRMRTTMCEDSGPNAVKPATLPPQREQIPDSSVQCMWPSKSRITNQPLAS
jgi:hypothetical protein